MNMLGIDNYIIRMMGICICPVDFGSPETPLGSSTHNLELNSQSMVRIWADAPLLTTPELTGAVAYTEGQLLTVFVADDSPKSLNIKHQDSGSLAENRCVTKTGLALNIAQGKTASFVYIQNRWREI